ncbi:MAG: hypothetical protein ACLP9L_26115 [Thermoguttaceae bacterium]
MATAVRWRYTATGSTVYFTVRDDITGKMWNTNGTPNFEALTVANWSKYAIAMTETPSSSYFYVGTMPAISGNMVAAWYWVDVYLQASGSAAISDTQVATIYAYWDGTNLKAQASDTIAIAGSVQSVPGAAGGIFIAGSNAATTLASLTISGAVDFQSTFIVTGLTTLTGGLTISAATSLTTLSTSGATTFNSLVVTTTTTLTGNVSLSGTLVVAGTVTFNALALTSGHMPETTNTNSYLTAAAPTAAAIATAVLTDTTSGDLNTAGSPGYELTNSSVGISEVYVLVNQNNVRLANATYGLAALQALISAGTITGSVASSPTSGGSFSLTDLSPSLSTTANAYVGMWLVFTSGVNTGISRIITTLNATTGAATFATSGTTGNGAFPNTPTAGDTFMVLAAAE